jgi:uncharacterized DUF497 family protein
VKFEWSAAKAARNLKVHGVSFDDASTVFGDPLAGTIDDPRGSSWLSPTPTEATQLG